MYVKVVLWVKRNNNSSVVVLTTTESVSCLLSSYDMAELYKNLTVSIAYNHSSRKYISLNFNCFVCVRSRYLDAYNVSKYFTLLYYILLYSFDFLWIEKIFNREHIQKLNYSTCCCAMLAYWKLFVIWHCLVHLYVCVFLQAFTSSLNFQPLVFDFQLI